MLELPQSLPIGALLDRDALRLAEAVSATGGLWFTASPDMLTPEAPGPETPVTGWHSTIGRTTLRPSEPNSGNTRFTTATPHPGLMLTEGVHCGLWLARATRASCRFSAAVIYSAPEGDPRTLLSLNTGQEHNLIFLSDADGQLSLRDRATGSGMDIALPAESMRPRLAILSYDGRELALHGANRTVKSAANLPGLDRPGDLFVGCRSNRRGLLKTLGRSVIHDVLFWHDRAILLEATPVTGLQTLIARYHHWAY